LGISGGFEGFYEFVGQLNRTLNIPAILTDLGVTNPDVEKIVDAALRDPSCGGNPMKLTKGITKDLSLSCLYPWTSSNQKRRPRKGRRLFSF
jgi:4-hydroxybutyrate dehydrogenase